MSSRGPGGCVNLDALHARGRGVPRDLEAASRLYTRACEARSPLGCRNLARAYADGRGVRRDPARAREYEALAERLDR